jgi:hypothetical protein
MDGVFLLTFNSKNLKLYDIFIKVTLVSTLTLTLLLSLAFLFLEFFAKAHAILTVGYIWQIKINNIFP